MPEAKKHSPMIQPKLTEEQVREIKAIYRMAHKLRKKKGLKLLRAGLAAEVGKKYGVSARTIQHIQTGDRWRSVK
jgi:hypothetical protein